MSSEKNRPSKLSGPDEKLLDPDLVKLLGITILGYVLLWAVVGSLLGAGFAALLTTPLLAISLFVIAKWDRTRTSNARFSFKRLAALPSLNYWNILVLILSIFIVGQLLTLAVFTYLYKARAEFIVSAPDNVTGFFNAITEDRQSAILFLTVAYISYAVGGFIAGWLPNKKCPAPYRHAVVASIVYSLLNIVLIVPLLIWGNQGETPSQQEAAGLIILQFAPAFIFSMLGVWLAVGTRKEEIIEGTSQATESNKADTSNADSPINAQAFNNSVPATYKKGRRRRDSKGKNVRGKLDSPPEKDEHPPTQAGYAQVQEQSYNAKVRWTRRRISILSVSMVVIAFIGVMAWVLTMPSPVNCPDPPETATLNCWPVTYSLNGEYCHDYPPINARIVGENHHYMQSKQEWERGITAHVGDEIYALVYINNGAATNAENINPGRGIARNVRLTTEISQQLSVVHYINVRFASDNTNTVASSFKILTAEQGRLEIIPRSGQIRNSQATEVIAHDIDIGNNTIMIGDLPPKFEDSVFIRFSLKVIP